MVEMAPVTARPPVEKIVPIRGVKSVVPQVGQPAPRAIRPVIMPAFSRLAEFWFFFLFHSRTMRPIKMPCRIEMAKIGIQSRKGWLIPNIATKLSIIILRLFGKPNADINSNLENPPDSKFMRNPKNRNAGINPHQKRFSLVASRIPLPARAKPSSHFLQFMTLL